MKPLPKPDGGKVREPDLSLAAATGSGEIGWDDLSNEARSSRGDAAPLLASEGSGAVVELDDAGMRDGPGGLMLEEDACFAVTGIPIANAALPFKAVDCGRLAAVRAERVDRFEGLTIAVAEEAAMVLSTFDAAGAPCAAAALVDSGLPESLRPRAGESRPSGAAAKGSAPLLDDAPDPTASWKVEGIVPALGRCGARVQPASSAPDDDVDNGAWPSGAAMLAGSCERG